MQSFPSTHWSEIEQASESLRAGADLAVLGRLVERYHRPLLAHLRRRFAFDPQQASDALQDFLVQRVLQRDVLRFADRERGRFRTFLLTALENHVVNQFRADNAQKRKPERGWVPLESADGAVDCDAQLHVTHEFDVDWARSVLKEALERTRAQCDALNRPDLWGVLECRVLRPLLDDLEPMGYEALIERFGFSSPTQASNALTSVKRIFSRMLVAVVREYCNSDEEANEELRELWEILTHPAVRLTRDSRSAGS